MTPEARLLAAWQLEPSVLSGCALLLGLYLGLARPLTARALAFAAGVLLLLLALVSPLDALADTYLFSAHMLQHMLLTLVVPPLLLLGLPPRLVCAAEARVGWRGPGLPATWALFNGALWLWHIPAFYDAALRNHWPHIAEHLIFLATATGFWWPVLAPTRRPPSPPAAFVYLSGAVAASSVLGIVLAFAPPDLYPAYLSPDDRLGLLGLLRDGWGLGPAADQQLGGLLMWIPGGLLFAPAVLATAARWLDEGGWEMGDRGRPTAPGGE
jgi:putative membrane protein